MSAREKVSTQEFTIETDLDPQGIREAAQRAAEAGTRFLESTVHEAGVADSVIGYSITGPGGFVEQMELAVGWEDVGEGRRRVTLEVGDFGTSRWVLWGFIPIGPKAATGMGSLKRFSERLRKELS